MLDRFYAVVNAMVPFEITCLGVRVVCLLG